MLPHFFPLLATKNEEVAQKRRATLKRGKIYTKKKQQQSNHHEICSLSSAHACRHHRRGITPLQRYVHTSHGTVLFSLLPLPLLLSSSFFFFYFFMYVLELFSLFLNFFINCSSPLILTTHSHHAHSLEYAACCRPENGHPVRLSRRIG